MKKLITMALMILGIVLLPTYLTADTTQAQDIAEEKNLYIPVLEVGEQPTLSLPFNVVSQWTSADSDTKGVNWQTGDNTVRFAIQDNKFIPTNPEDTWFIYGWFGPIEAIQRPYNIKYPQWGNRHNGIDFAGRIGLDIVSASKGTVIFAGNKIGKTVIVDAGGGYRITYGHLLDINVKVGDKVKTGDVVGHLGATGTVNPHLHFEVDQYINNQRIAVNPLTLMNVNWNKIVIPNADANRFYNGPQDPKEQPNFIW